MKIVEKKINEILAYEKNPRSNEEAVKYVANSIKHFGFKVPIVIDSNGVIVCGHTRHKAAMKLGLKKVPCIVADDLTDEQIKAFRLADNKVAEKAKWVPTLLQHEMIELPEFDFTDFGFHVPEIKPPNQRMNTVKTYNLDYFVEEDAENKWGMPELEGIDYVPKNLIGFNYAKTSKDYESGIHFYIDDYQFERCWNNPEKYMEILERFDCVLTPDFSLYLDMPLAMQMWNVYRSRMLGQIWQNYGMNVIPTVSWSTEDSFEFCFDGLPHESTVSVSTIGVKQTEESMLIWKAGMDEMIRRISPSGILLYGGMVYYDFGDIEVLEYNNHTTERMKR